MDAPIVALREADREGIDAELYGASLLEQRLNAPIETRIRQIALNLKR